MIVFLAFVHGSPGSLVIFEGICIVVVVVMIAATFTTSFSCAEAIRDVSFISAMLGVYSFLIGAFVNSGWLEKAFLPYGPLFLVCTVSVAVAVGFTRLGIRIAKSVPLAWLVGFQGFRLPLELVLHDWYTSGTIPETRTWTCSHWDI